VYPAGCEVDGDKTRLEVSRYERNLATSLDLSKPARSESEGCSPGEKRTTIHVQRYDRRRW